MTDEDREVGRVFPPLHRIRQVSAQIAKAVANKAYELGKSRGEGAVLARKQGSKRLNVSQRTSLHLFSPHYAVLAGVATYLPKPPDLFAYALSRMYDPHYRKFR